MPSVVPPSSEPFLFDDQLPKDLPIPDLGENARIVLGKRYLKKDDKGKPVEEPETMFWRVAYTIAKEDKRFGATEEAVEGVAREFYDLMTKGKFEPNSPTLMNAGRPLGQLSACFVLPVEDALSNGRSGIYDTLKAMALVHQSGGGTGFAFSRLRPTGDTVRSTMGVASGPVSFMRLYDASTEVVKQGGTRRGANMGILRVDHPDIREFITCKSDTSKITNFNISVAVTDAFMEAVEQGGKYDLLSPRTGEVAGQEDAREIFDLIVQGAWQTGEPGVFFVDRANEVNPVPHLGSYEATNPCFVGSTRLATDRGLLTMGELERERMEIRVATDNRVPGIRAMAAGGGGTAVATRTGLGITVRPAVPVFKTRENWPVFTLKTRDGYEVTATADHKFFTPTGLVELQDLKAGDRILLQSGEGPWSTDRSLPEFQPDNKFAARVARREAEPPTEWSKELGQLLGWVVADGWVTEDLPEGRHIPNYTVGLLFGGDEKELAPEFQERIRRWTGMRGNRTERAGRIQLIYRSGLYYFLRSLGLVTEDGKSNRVPQAIWRAPRDAVVGFLQGLFSADGTVNVAGRNWNACSVRLASSTPELLQEVQILLQNLGISSKIRLRRKAGRRLMPDGRGGMKEYAHKAQYELILDKINRDRFLLRVGFLAPAKQAKGEHWIRGMRKYPAMERFVDEVLSVEPVGREDVYCTTENRTNSIVCNGIVVSNCGEQPLLAYDVCNLGSINLGLFVKEDFAWGGDPMEGVDWEALARVVHLSTHFLDNVIDANRYPLPEITELAQRIRRVGLGVMGWADMLVRLGIPYNSDDGVEMGRRVMEFLNEEARKASEKLAATRGVFPEWERSIWGPDESCARGPDGERIRLERRLRNCNITTVAPTGTISIFAGCSGGIEPLFAVAFMRNQAGAKMPDVNRDFVRIAREQGWYSHELMERIATQGHIHFPEVPQELQRVFVTAHDITPEWHVRMQGAFQEHTDSAISKTTNFPTEATEADVRKIYELAFRLGCKGVTVYRDGSRPEQVLSTGKTGQAAEAPELAARRAELEHELADARELIHRLRGEVEGLKGELEERDRTAAAARRKRQRPSMLKGRTLKMNSPLGDIYVTINEDAAGRPFEVFCTLGKAGGAAFADAEAIGRLMSLALRSGVPITAIRDQLRGISSDRAVGVGPNKVLSAPDAIGQAIDRYLEEQAGIQEELPIPIPLRLDVQPKVAPARHAGTHEHFMGSCPDCGSGQLVYEEGCVKCHICGYSECG
jgi:ribonucleoside-diphosphate reductase alpha chain